MRDHGNPDSFPEKLYKIKAAAAELNLHYWWLLRAIKRGDVPCYTPFNRRRLVRLSEIVAFIEASRQGGIDHA